MNDCESIYLQIDKEKFTLTGVPSGATRREWKRVCNLREAQMRRGLMALGWAPVDKHRPFRYLWDCLVIWIRRIR